MKITISKEDILKSKIEIARNDLNKAMIKDTPQREKHCYMAYKQLQDILKMQGVEE